LSGAQGMARTCFSALQRAENFSIPAADRQNRRIRGFSALQRAENFSIGSVTRPRSSPSCFSALQRAENFSIERCGRRCVRLYQFQCSSASRKFLNHRRAEHRRAAARRFSALQRAENFSMSNARCAYSFSTCFSALQRAENFSICLVVEKRQRQFDVSVLFSEPKISQFTRFARFGRI